MDLGPVMVVGAGLSGLVAAYRLRQAGLGVLVAEAAGRLGGRLMNQQVAGAVVDGGGAWVGPTQTRVLALLRELGLETVPTFDDGRHLLRLNGRVRTRSGSMPPLSMLATFDLAALAAQLDRLAVTTGRPAQELSLLAFAQHVQVAGGTMQLFGVGGAAQDSRIAGGAATLCERLADRLGAGAIRLERPVIAVEQSPDRARVHFADGAVDVAAVVVAVDPAGGRRIDFGPSLPPAPRLLHDRWTMGSGIKFHMAYERPFWRDAGFSGQFVADDGLVRITFDATTDAEGPGILAGFIGEVPAGDPVFAEPSAARGRAGQVAAELAELFGPPAAHPVGYIEQDWRSVDHPAGCGPARPPGALTGPDAPPRQRGRVWFAGAESADVWEGHMDGAVRAGEQAAAAVLAQ